MSERRSNLRRRDVLRGIGATAAAGVLPAAACAPEAYPGQAGGDAGLDAAADTAADGSPDTPADAAGDVRSDVPVVGPPALAPLRRDGSHVYDYIDTIVVLQMENRSFDHYFGSLSLVEGRGDVDGLVAAHRNRTRDGREVLPRHLSMEWVIDPDPGHGHGDSLEQFGEGRNDGFVTNWERKLDAGTADRLDWVMGYHTRNELPALYGLADGFALCDRWFCSLLGPTWPNRYFSHAATSDGQWRNGQILEAPTPYVEAMARGLRFGVYRTHPVHFMMTVMKPAMDEYPNLPIDDFFVHAEQGTLPNITIVEPHYGLNDDHPPHDVRLGQAFVAGVYEALRQSPQWDRCLMLVLYDEHGGFHDHVAPPKVQGEERAAEGFDQLGFRIPGLVVGPLVRPGSVFSEVVDHASLPALISRVFDLQHVNERSRLAGDFANALDIERIVDSRRQPPPALPEISIPSNKLRLVAALPFGQPELAEFALRHHGIEAGGFDETMRSAERWLRALERLRVARVD